MILYECERLSARISQAQCERNRSRVDNFANDVLAVNSCRGCSGLGAAVKIDVEGLSMTAKKCSVQGCTRQAQISGKCKSHHNGTPQRNIKSPAFVADVVGESAPVIAEVPVSDHEIHVVNLVELFKAKQQEELEAFITTLSSLAAEPLKKLEYAYWQVR